jgi:8-oxo-(d)GTP phosphatase
VPRGLSDGSPETIRAAGALLWRPAESGPVGSDVPEIALVHRPRYDDWSLPKGKLLDGEHPLVGAAREVQEETGHSGPLGRPLGTQRYVRKLASGPTPKVVEFWAMRVTEGEFHPTDEIDELRWLDPDEASARLSRDSDRDVLTAFLSGPRDSVPVVLIRHGSAGERSRWPGPDRERPLDEKGRAQAEALVPLLELYRVDRVFSSDFVRCVDTVAPFARAHGLKVEGESLLSESRYSDHRQATYERLTELLDVAVATGTPTAICSQGKVMPDLVRQTCQRFHFIPPRTLSVRKGSFWVLHLVSGGLAGLERYSPVSGTDPTS